MSSLCQAHESHFIASYRHEFVLLGSLSTIFDKRLVLLPFLSAAKGDRGTIVTLLPIHHLPSPTRRSPTHMSVFVNVGQRSSFALQQVVLRLQYHLGTHYETSSAGNNETSRSRINPYLFLTYSSVESKLIYCPLQIFISRSRSWSVMAAAWRPALLHQPRQQSSSAAPFYNTPPHILWIGTLRRFSRAAVDLIPWTRPRTTAGLYLRRRRNRSPQHPPRTR